MLREPRELASQRAGMFRSKTDESFVSPRLLVKPLTKGPSPGMQAAMMVVAPSILQCRRQSVQSRVVDGVEDNDVRGPDDVARGIIGEVLASEDFGKKSGIVGGDTGGTKHIRTDAGRPLKGGHFVHRSYAKCGAERKLFPPAHRGVVKKTDSGVDGKV